MGRELLARSAILVVLVGCSSPDGFGLQRLLRFPGQEPDPPAVGRNLAEELALERWRRCKELRGVRYKELRDGEIWIEYTSEAQLLVWRECDRRVAQEQFSQAKASATIIRGRPEAAAAPVWRVGTEWAYRWTDPEGDGVAVWSVDREQVVNGTDCYVIKSPGRETYLRKADLAFVMETLNRQVELVWNPPRLGFVWPLSVGKTWQQDVVEDRSSRGQRTQLSLTGLVESEEIISVAAGSFRAFKVVVRARSPFSGVLYEAWYAHDVKQVIKIAEPTSSGVREFELFAHRQPAE